MKGTREEGEPGRPRWLSAFAGKVEAGVVSLYSHNERGGRGGRRCPHNLGFGSSLPNLSFLLLSISSCVNLSTSMAPNVEGEFGTGYLQEEVL